MLETKRSAPKGRTELVKRIRLLERKYVLFLDFAMSVIFAYSDVNFELSRIGGANV